MTYLIYSNSIFQALSLYALAIYYDFYLVSLPSRKGKKKDGEGGRKDKVKEKKRGEKEKRKRVHHSTLGIYYDFYLVFYLHTKVKKKVTGKRG
jgi:hypothetical protein